MMYITDNGIEACDFFVMMQFCSRTKWLALIVRRRKRVSSFLLFASALHRWRNGIINNLRRPLLLSRLN